MNHFDESQCRQKGFAQIVFILILLAGIALTVYLTQFTQVFKPKASETVSSIPPGKYGSTPTSEVGNYPKPQNPVQITAFLVPVSDSDKSFMEKEFDYWFEGGDGGGDLNNYLTSFHRFKSINPKLKTTMGVRAAYVAINTWPWPLMTNQDLLHNPDGTPLADNNDPNIRYLNLSSPQVREKMATGLTANLNQHNIDAIVFDYWYPNVYLILLGTRTCLEPGCNTLPFWVNSMSAFYQKLKSLAPNKDFFSVAEPDPNEPTNLDGYFYEHLESFLTDSTFFKKNLSLIDQTTAKGKKIFMFVQPRFLCLDNFACAGDKVPVGSGWKPIDLELERFYLATYLLIQNNPLTYFGYYPGSIYNGVNEGLYFYKDWNQDYGTPTGKWIEPAPNYYVRIYTNGYAVVNSSDQPQAFGVPQGLTYREWDRISGPVVSGNLSIPPKTGKFFFTQVAPGAFTLNPPQMTCQSSNTTVGLVSLSWSASPNGPIQGNGGYLVYIDGQVKYNVLTDLSMTDVGNKTPGQKYVYRIKSVTTAGEVWSNEQTLTALNCVNPSPSPSASPKKPGDTDGDNDVDIFDYNLILTDFGKTNDPNTKADLDNDDDVDIFDYNIVLTNFGK